MARSNEKLKAIVPFTATTIDAVKGIYNVLSYYREPIPRTQLDILFRDHAKVGSRSLADSRLDWYTKHSLMYYSRPRSISAARNQYLIGIDKEKVLELYELCEDVDWYGFYPAQKVAISFKQFYREKKVKSSTWIGLSYIAKWLETTTASIYGLTDDNKDIFTDAIVKPESPVEISPGSNDPAIWLYRPKTIATTYLDGWKRISSWIDANLVTRHIDVPVPKGVSKRIAIWK